MTSTANRRPVAALFVLLVASGLAVACTSETDDAEEVKSTDQNPAQQSAPQQSPAQQAPPQKLVPHARPALTGDPEDPPVGHNGLAPRCLFDSSVLHGLVALGHSGLADEGGSVRDRAELRSACGGEMLQYLTTCALGQDQSVVDSHGVTLHGRFGLARDFRSAPLAPAGQELVTGCLLQHLNGLGKHVPIAIETSSAKASEARRADFALAESALWGNLFTNDAQVTTVFACGHDDLIGACSSGATTGDWHQTLKLRVCGDAPGCDLRIEGTCSDSLAAHAVSARIRPASASARGALCAR